MAWYDFIKAIRRDEEEEKKRDREGGVFNKVSGFLDDALDVGGRTAKKAVPVRDFVVDVARSIPRGVYGLGASVGENAQDDQITGNLENINTVRGMSYSDRKKRSEEDMGFRVLLKTMGVDDPTDKSLDAAEKRLREQRDNNSTYRPKGAVSWLLGDEPIQTIQERRRGYEKVIKESPGFSGVRDAATPLSVAAAFGMGALDLPTGGGSLVKSFGSKTVTAIAKEGSEQGIRELMAGKAPQSFIDRVAPTLAKTTDEKAVRSILGQADQTLTSKTFNRIAGRDPLQKRLDKAGAASTADDFVEAAERPILNTDNRPGAEVQKQIEDALNSGDKVRAQQLVDGMPEGDLKAGMQSTLDSLSGKRTGMTAQEFLASRGAAGPPPATPGKTVKFGDDADHLLDLMKTTTQIEKMKPGGTFKQKAYQQFFDKLSPLHRMVKEVEKRRGSSLAVEDNPYALARLYAGMPAQVKDRVQQVSDVLETVPDIDAVRVVGVARRILGRPDVQGTISPEQAQRAIMQIQQKLGPEGYKKVDDAVSSIVQYNESLLRELADSGVLSKEAVDEIIERNPDYFARFNVVGKLLERADRDIFKSGQSLNLSRQNVIKAMKGMQADSEILDPIEAIVKATDLSMRTMAKNRIWQSLDKLADEAPDLIKRVRDPENVAERIKLSLENKALRPVRNKVERLIKTRGGWVRRLQSELDRLEKQGLQASLKEGGRTPLPEFNVAGLGGELPTSQSGKLKPVDFIADMQGNVRGNDAARIDRLGRSRDAARAKADELLPQGEGLIPVKGNEEGIAAARRAAGNQKAINETIRKRGTAQDFPVNPSQLGPRDTAAFVRSLVEGGSKKVEQLKRKIATREPKLAGILDDIGRLSKEYDELAGKVKENTARARGELADLDVPEGFDVVGGFANGVGGRLAIPKEIADVYKGMTASQMNYLTKVVSGVNKVLKETVTTLSLPFAFIRNPIRDFKAMASNSKNIPARLDKIVKAWGGGLASAIKQDDMYKRWIKSGGGGAGIYSNQETGEELAKRLTRKINGPEIHNMKDFARESFRFLTAPIRKGSEVVQKAGATLEAAPRLAEFKAATKKGLSDEAAAFAARNVTVDFNQSGTVGQVMNQWVPFLNARLQGNKKLLEAAKNNPLRFAGIYSTLTLPPMVATIAWNQQFPEVMDQIPANIKDNNFIVVLGDEQDEQGNFTQVLKIPKGDMDKIFGNPLENFMGYFAGQDPKGFAQVVTEMIGNVSPVDIVKDGKPNLSRAAGGILPVVAKVPIEQATNHNLYFDAPIVPESMQDLPNEMQVRDNTPAVDRFLAGLTGASPIKTQAARQGVTGQLFSERPDEALGGAVTGAPSTATTNEFYKILGKTSKARAGASKKVNEAIAAGDYQKAMEIANEYNTYLREQFTPWAKRYGKYANADLQDRYNEQKLNLTKRGLKQRRRSQLEASAR